MQNSTEWSKKYYSPEAQSKVEDQKKLWNPELQAQVTKQWTELVAARRRTLVEGFTGGDPEIQKGLNKMWADKANWPTQERERFPIDPRVQEFIVKAMNATRR
jgi:hypothetical protein